MNDSAMGLSSSPETSACASSRGSSDNLSATIGDGAFGSQPGGDSMAAASNAAFQDQLHEYMQGKFAGGTAKADASSSGYAGKDGVLIADSGSSSFGTVLNYAGYITYAGLAASAFGHDDPFQLQTRATRFFQEKILHHHAIDNPQVWAAMGDALMTEQHLASQGAKFKPLKLGTLKGEIKREDAGGKGQDDGKALEKDAKEANDIIKDITSGLKSPDDYVLAAKFLYSEGVAKADARALKESTDHKDEKRLLGRLNLLSGETDRTDAVATRDNSVNPMLDQLGARVSFRLDEAALLDRYGSKVPELGWAKEAADLRAQARAIYDDPNALSEPVRRRLHSRYADTLSDIGTQI